MKNIKYILNSKFLLSLILISTISINLLIFLPIGRKFKPAKEIQEKTVDFYGIKNSGPEINVTTPENITYSKPMEGYYPGTFGFENDKLGDSPQGWEDHSGTNCYAQIVDEIDGHKNVLDLYDNSDPYSANVTHSLEVAQSVGVIEWWWRHTATNRREYITAFNDDGSYAFIINAHLDGKYYEWTEGSGVPYSANTWYHHKLEFDCNGNAGSGRIDWYIDGELKESNLVFSHDGGKALKTFKLKTREEETGGFHSYFDAVGFSWDPNYNVGDNIYEGLLLSFEKSFNEEWLGYSLDGQANKTILGNSTIPIPENAMHTIQVFGNDSIGANYESDIRTFTIDYYPIKIINPENITYSKPMEGYYLGTFGFENDKLGDSPQGWEDHSGTNCYAQIVDEIDGHKNVLDLYDNSDPYSANVTHSLEVAQSVGVIEWWWRHTATNRRECLTVFNDDGSYAFIINAHLDGKYYEWTEGSGIPYSANTWYHHRIDFSCSGNGGNGRIDWYIDGELKESNLIFSHIGGKAIKTIELKTREEETGGFHSYFDAVGFSWDPNYNVGDNIYEGLLLSFEKSFNEEWLGYSLDGQPTKEILGNITIPFLNDGSHFIQVFGNNSFDTTFESEICYFSIDTTAPLIIINSPSPGEYFGNSAPNFVISIIEPNLDSTWYTLDNGISNIPFTGYIGMIDQDEWNNFSDGPITIRFYANDSFGFMDYTPIMINKDVSAPTSMISFIPYMDSNIANKSTKFTITANDGIGSGVSIIRYKINDSGWILYTNPFDLSGYEAGDYLITYQAVDNIGNIETENTLLVELIRPSSEAEISSYNLFILIGFTGITLLILLRKKLKIK